MNKSIHELLPVIEETVRAGGKIKLRIKGSSMSPMLRSGRDCVVLSKPEGIRKYDVVFYRRSNGVIVLHRIVGKNSSGYILCGDAQLCREYGITEKNILAKAESFVINGSYVSSRVCRIAGILFSVLRPLRYAARGGRRWIKKLLNGF